MASHSKAAAHCTATRQFCDKFKKKGGGAGVGFGVRSFKSMRQLLWIHRCIKSVSKLQNDECMLRSRIQLLSSYCVILCDSACVCIVIQLSV